MKSKIMMILVLIAVVILFSVLYFNNKNNVIKSNEVVSSTNTSIENTIGQNIVDNDISTKNDELKENIIEKNEMSQEKSEVKNENKIEDEIAKIEKDKMENKNEENKENKIEEEKKDKIEIKNEEKSNKKTIVIDPGHQTRGNSSKEPIGPGATETKAKVTTGATGIHTKQTESKLNLKVALLLENELKKRNYNVIMTRTTNDVNISNMERAEIANNANADAFIRIHADSYDDSSVNRNVYSMSNIK